MTTKRTIAIVAGGDSGENGLSGSYFELIRMPYSTCPRQALHARTLGFVHPRTGEEMFFPLNSLPIWLPCSTVGVPM